MVTEDSVYNSIEQAILEHRLVPGTRLQELKLSKIYNVKRGLVRKVLSRLSHAKLVNQQANQGAQVASPSLKEAQDLFATRVILEKAVVQQLCQHCDDDQINYLRKYVKDEYETYHQGHLEKAKKMSANFHLELAKISNNTLLISYLNDIINQTPLIMLSHSNSHSNCLNDDHKHIVEAIAEHDEATAIQLLIEHINQISNSMNGNTQQASKDLFEVLKG